MRIHICFVLVKNQAITLKPVNYLTQNRLILFVKSLIVTGIGARPSFNVFVRCNAFRPPSIIPFNLPNLVFLNFEKDSWGNQGLKETIIPCVNITFSKKI